MDRFSKNIAIMPKGNTTAHWNAIHFDKWSRNYLNKIFTSRPTPTGEKTKNMKFHLYKTLAKQRGYTHDTYEFSLHAYITPRVLEVCSVPLKCFKYEKKDGKEFLSPDFSDFDKLKENEYFDLHREIKKGRPITFITHNITDTGDYTREVGHQEALYWLFKDDVDFYHVSRFEFDVGVCEYFVRGDPFSALWKGKAMKEGGKSTENYFSAKMGFIDAEPKRGFFRLPTKSVPILLNQGGRVREKGSWGVVNSFIDANGTECTFINNSLSKGNSDSRGVIINKTIDHYKKTWGKYYRPWQDQGKIEVRKRIRFFKIMETLNWEYDENSELLKSHYKDIHDLTHQETIKYKIGKGTVINIDMDKREIHIRGKTGQPNSKEEDHIIHFAKHPRVLLNKKRTTDIIKIKNNDIVTLIYRIKSNTTDYKTLFSIARREGRRRATNDGPGYTDGIYLHGKITAIDLAKSQCTVVMPELDKERGEWKAFELYEKELKPLGMPEPSEIVKGWDFCKKIYYGDETARTFIITIDDAMDFAVNGRISTLDKASIGDRIVFSMTGFHRDNDIHPYYYPDTVHVVKDGPLVGDELIFKANE